VFNLLIGIVIASMEKARQHEAHAHPSSDAELIERIAEVRRSLRAVEIELMNGSGSSPRQNALDENT
jgi:hypothetical protein